MANIIKITLPDGSTYDVGNSLCLGINNKTWNAQETQFTGTLDYTETEIHELVTNGTFVWFQYYDSLEDDIVMLFPSGDNYWRDLEYYRVAFLTANGITVQVRPGYATLSSPAFSGTPTAPNPMPLDDSTKIATTAWVNSKITLAIPEIEEAAKTTKIYYVLTKDGYGEWSGSDYSDYNFIYGKIYEENDNTSNTVSTNEIFSEISNGILVILGVYDPNSCLVYCIPSLIGDDAQDMAFSATYTTLDDVLVTLNLTMGIGGLNNCDGYYSLPSGGGSDLPSVTSSDYNKYLHTNASTGALEWSTISSQLPSVSSSDNGKFLRVVNGAWAAASVPDANGVSF